MSEIIQRIIQRTETLRRETAEVLNLLRNPGNVPEGAWSSEDRKRMEEGKPPKHYPEHPNV